MLLLLSIVFLLFYAALIFFYYLSWTRASVANPAPAVKQAFLSLIVPARNEEGRIGPLLEALNSQTLGKDRFEVLVVDDFSTDRTASLVTGSSLPNLRLLRPDAEPELSSKKKAIECGVLAARGELIVTTDADCLPNPGWLQALHDFYVEKQAAFIAAPVRFSHDRSFLQVFQAIDFMILQGITAASVSARFHSMCNGANLAYRKQSFISVNGFQGIDSVATGDDMLLMHKIRVKEPSRVFYFKNREAIVTTEPMTGWKAFFMQRKRWASKTFVYDDRRIIGVLVFVYLFNLFFFALLVAAIIDSSYWWHLGGFWAAKTLIELPFAYSVAEFYGEKKLLRYFFLFQPLHIAYTVLTGLLSQGGRYEWKGRRTK